MTDWHSHILPGMDDGSRSAAESVQMLKVMAEDGRVDTVVATPHFYANDESVESFLQRRERAYRELEPLLTEGFPRILTGAEVRYYPGISRLDGLLDLRIAGSRLLLLEMPFETWTEYDIRELTGLACRGELRVILAHIERYTGYQRPGVIEGLLDSGIMLQTNANFVIRPATRHRALKMLRRGYVQFIGSDCHNLTTRPPNAGKAFEITDKKLGHNFLQEMQGFGNSLLGTAGS